MLTHLSPQPEDKILALSAQFKADPRPHKIDLGVGVYKDARGQTPIMRAVKAAEQKLWQEQDTKSYVALAGDPAFADAMIGLVLGQCTGSDRIAAVATPGGTGAVRQGLELVQLAGTGARVWVSDPTWPNHLTILKHLDLPMQPYRYFDATTRAVDFDGMVADLAEVNAGDVVLLHGCCHNPTGANLNAAQEDEVITLLNAKGAVAFVDIAYQGFGDGLEKDARFTRKIATRLPQVLIAASCSKNFGIYRERTGILMALSEGGAETKTVQGSLAFLNRQNYSFPPDHGARLVTMILGDATLRRDWEAELEAMRVDMLNLRKHLADSLRDATGSDRFGFLAQHRGMFSRLGTTSEMVAKLREGYGIYMARDSRMNIAGMTAATVPILAQAIVECGIQATWCNRT